MFTRKIKQVNILHEIIKMNGSYQILITATFLYCFYIDF